MPRHVDIPILVYDRKNIRDHLRGEQIDLLLASQLETVRIPFEYDFYDGPISCRVAILDFDENGQIQDGVKFLPEGIGKTVACYDVSLPHQNEEEEFLKAIESDEFIKVSTFGTVMKTIQFFESHDALGRRINWAFDSPQILVLPKAGTLANAFYERETGSLQFFYCQSNAGHTIYTALSHDIVVHETMHAILDGVAPDLYHATRTESLALHEALADIAAIILTLLNKMIIESVHYYSGSQLDIATTLSKIAEEFGTDIRREIGVDFLRVLNNDQVLDPDSIDLTDPYQVSEVLSGAVYTIFLKWAHNSTRDDVKSMLSAAKRISRMVFRALDYLPPGEVSLADFGRAMIASHNAIYKREHYARHLAEELVKRKIFSDETELVSISNHIGKFIENVDFDKILEDDTSAKIFAEENQELLAIPENADYLVQPRKERIRVQKKQSNQKSKKDLIFKVLWQMEDEHDLGSDFSKKWEYTAGTTLVLDWDTGEILSILTTDQGDAQTADRNRTLKSWVRQGLLVMDNNSKKFGYPLLDKIVAKKFGKVLRAYGSVRVLCKKEFFK